MKRLFIAFVLLTVCILSRSQVILDWDQLSRYQNVRLLLSVVDAKTGEALPYATVYLVPQGDTTVTNFALTDSKGAVDMRDIKPGKYEVNVELIGYNPYMKVHELKGWEKNLGEIALEENPEFIDAATITAIGNPIIVKRDTIEYNANAFRVGENAMLGDLLKKIPGMEVAEDGTVKVNGEAVDKITVGGKTFFFNDPSMAVKNLPARVVNKIKVIDKDKPQAAFTGVSNGKEDKEKVMDLELKDEFKDGWFGNVKAGVGANIPGKNSNELTEKSKPLYNGNFLVSGYNEHDQLVLLGGAQNAPDPGSGGFFFFGDGMDAFDSKMGQVTSGNIGANVNTDRIKTFQTSGGVTYKHSFKDAKELSARTSFMGDGSADLFTSGRYDGTGSSDVVNVSFQMERDSKEKVMFNIYPRFSFTRKDRNILDSSVSSRGGTQANSSSSSTLSLSKDLSTGVSFWTGIKDIGKKRRSITLGGNVTFDGSIGDSHETRNTTAAGSVVESRDLLYDNNSRYLGYGGDIAYTEPFGEKWSVQARAEGRFSRSHSGKDATDASSGNPNDYYSSIYDARYASLNERLLVQYSNAPTNITAGLQVEQTRSQTYSRNLGKESTAPGEWQVNLAPYVNARYTKDTFTATLRASGRSSTPSGSRILPALNISDPLQISTGNIYLRPSFSQDYNLGFSYNNPKTFAFIYLGGGASLSSKSIVSASWFDPNGIRYSIPVNAKSPSVNAYVYATANRPLDRNRQLSLELDGYLNVGTSNSFQATGTLPGLNTSSFNYTEMMASFWGDSSGDRFYSGQSGFEQSKTSALRWSASASLRWTPEHFTANAGYGVQNHISKYSLNPAANTSTWDHTFSASVMYKTDGGWEFQTDAVYTIYKGYAEGFNDPELIWNASVSKSIKAFTLSLKMADILGQTRSRWHSVAEEYVLDTYRNTLGRYFIFSVAWNFGKMNARNNKMVRDVMIRSAF